MADDTPPPTAKLPRLTPREERYIDEYMIDLDKIRAYLETHPRCARPNARVAASRLMARPQVKAEIAARKRDRRIRSTVSADMVERELARIAFSDVLEFLGRDGQLLPMRSVPMDARRTVKSLKVLRTRTRVERTDDTVTRTTEQVVEFAFWDKVAALEKLMRVLGLGENEHPLERLLRSLPTAAERELRALMARPDRLAPAAEPLALPARNWSHVYGGGKRRPDTGE